MSIGAAILIVGVLSLFVLGPSWFRKLVLALGAVGIIGAIAFFFIVIDPQAIAPYACKTAFGRAALSQADCREYVFDPDAFIAAGATKPVPPCTADQIQTIRREEKNPFADLVPGFLFTPAKTTGLKTAETIPGLSAACQTASAHKLVPVPVCTPEQMAKINAHERPFSQVATLQGGQLFTTGDVPDLGSACSTP